MRQLKYFLAISDCGSLSRAAQQVFIAQSALSKQVGDLEDELGVKLLYRSRSGVSLTESGHTFYAYATAILKQLGDAKAAVQFSPHTIVGSVVVGLPQSTCAALALPLFRAAKDRLPGVELHVNEELTGNMLDQIRQGRVDLAVFAPETGFAELACHPFVEEEFYFLHAPNSHDSCLQSDVSLAYISAQPLAVPSSQHSHLTRAHLAAALDNAGLPLKVAVEMSSVHLLLTAVEAGMAATVMPYALAAHQVAAGRLVAHRIRPEVLTRTLGVCHSRHLPMTNAKKAVCDLVVSVARELCANGQWIGAQFLDKPVTAISTRDGAV